MSPTASPLPLPPPPGFPPRSSPDKPGPWIFLVHDAILSRHFNAAAAVILVYDFLLTFSDEVQRIWDDRTWTGAKVLWVGHRYLNLVNFVVLPMIMDAGVRCGMYRWFPLLETIISQFFIAAILSFRCWALFGGSYRILVILIAVYACCLGLQLYPAVITFDQPVISVPEAAGMGDRYIACFLSKYDNMLDVKIRPWRIAGWAGNVVFDAIVTVLTILRAIRLRESGVRVTLAEIMLQDGIYYFVTVLTLNLATVVTFATLPPPLQLLLQRMTQVLTVVMISHMFLNLKGRNRHGSKSTEIRRAPSNFHTKRHGCYETEVSLETRVSGPAQMLSLVGNLGNDLMHPSILGHWFPDDKSTATIELQPRPRSQVEEAADQPSAYKTRNSEDSSVLPSTPTIKTTRAGLRPITSVY